MLLKEDFKGGCSKYFCYFYLLNKKRRINFVHININQNLMKNLQNKKYFEAKNKKGDNIYLTNARSYQKTNKYSVWGLDLSFLCIQIALSWFGGGGLRYGGACPGRVE